MTHVGHSDVWYQIQYLTVCSVPYKPISIIKSAIFLDQGQIVFGNKINIALENCNYILFTKLPWPGGSKGTFRFFSQAATYPPVYHTWWRLHTVHSVAERQAGELWISIFIAFGLTPLRIEPRFTASVADALPNIQYPLNHWSVYLNTTLVWNLEHINIFYSFQHNYFDKIWGPVG